MLLGALGSSTTLADVTDFIDGVAASTAGMADLLGSVSDAIVIIGATNAVLQTLTATVNACSISLCDPIEDATPTAAAFAPLTILYPKPSSNCGVISPWTVEPMPNEFWNSMLQIIDILAKERSNGNNREKNVLQQGCFGRISQRK